MFSTTISGALHGVEGMLLQIEVDVSNGLPCLEMVGLLGSEVKEAKERVRVAIKNLGVSIPPKRILVNLSPANVRKVGTAYDLPIAIGILKAMGILPMDCTDSVLLLGELGLDGVIKPVTGVLPILTKAYAEGIKTCIVAQENVGEAQYLKSMNVYGFSTMAQLMFFLQQKSKTAPIRTEKRTYETKRPINCFEDIVGQESGKRAALISAAGGHNLLYVGPPGTGKTMLVKALQSILPPLYEEERMEVASIQSVMGNFDEACIETGKRPFVEIHHSATVAALIGGGIVPRAGAMTMAHKGVLFLDELPEFKRVVLDAMRQPLEEKKICFIRTGTAYTFPSDVMLIAAMNPCPCGYYPDKNKCICLPYQVKNYISHISGPILDRIDVVAQTMPMNTKYSEQRAGIEEGMTSEKMQEMVIRARKVQKYRANKCNGNLDSREIIKVCPLEKSGIQLLNKMEQKFSLSGRAYYSLLKVARTIADLEESEKISEKHLAEAAGYRLGFERYFYG